MTLFDLVAKLTLDSSEYESGLQRAGKAIGTVAKVGAAAFAAAGAAVVAFAKDAVNVGAQFDTAMSQVAATMGTTVDQIDNLREFAQEMGRTTVFSATQAAEALNYMALAGYDAEKAMSMLPTVLDLAAAGAMDLARASDMVTDAESALGLTTEEAAAMVDQMAKTASKSNTSVEQLGDAMLTIGGTAQFMAGGTDRLATVLGILADNGIKGSEAGTHLRNMLLKLSAPTDAGAKIIKQLGLEIYDSSGKMRDMQDIILDLGAAMENMTDQQKINVISELFNARDVAAVNALLGTSVERWNELGEAIKDSEGAAAQMAATQLDNLNGDITLFKSALEGAKIAISDQLTPSLREFVQLGTSGLEKVTSAFNEEGLSGAMSALGDWFGDVAAKITEALPTILDAAGQLLSAFGQAIMDNAPLFVESLFKMIKSAFEKLGDAGQVKSAVTNITQLVKTIADGIVQAVPVIIPAAVQLIIGLVEGLTDPDNVMMLTEAAIDIILALNSALIDALPELIQAVPVILENLVVAFAESAPEILAGVGQLIWDSITGTIDAIGGEGTSDKIVDWFRGIPDAISTFFSETLPGVIDNIVQWFEGIPQWFDELPSRLGAAIGTAIGTVIQFGLDVYNWATTELPGIVEGIAQWFADLPGKIGEWLSQVVQRFSEWASNLAQTAATEIPQLVNDIITWFSELPQRIVEVGRQIVNGLWEGIQSGWNWLISKIKEFTHSLIDAAKSVLGIASPSKVFREIGGFVTSGFVEGIDNGIPGIVAAAKEMSEAAISAVDADAFADMAAGFEVGDATGFVVREQDPKTTEAMDQIASLLAEIRDKSGNVMLDGNLIVGYVDDAMGTMSMQKARAYG